VQKARGIVAELRVRKDLHDVVSLRDLGQARDDEE
jgi:hypothetical protein